MALQLRVTSHHAQFMVGDAMHEFGASGQIGRAADNDMVLPDPERIVSSTHARVTRRGNEYYLTDTSTNGTWINGGQMVPGSEQQLSDGDQIQMGEFEFLAVLVETPTDRVLGSAQPPESPPAQPPELPSERSSELSSDLSSGLSSDLSSGLGELFSAPAAAVPDEAALPRMNTHNPGAASLDPLDLLADDGPTTSQADELPLTPQRDDAPADQDFFQLPASQPDPNLPTAGAGEIPDDWLNLDQTEEPQAPASGAAAIASAAALSQAAAAEPTAPARSMSEADLSALLQAAGLDASQVDGNVAEIIGQILPVVVQGMIEVLRGRNEIKNEFRVPQTMLKPTDNNPLKVAVSAAEAMQILFSSTGGGYLDPVTAFSEGFGDIKNHQIAMLMGMRAGFEEMLSRFQPQNLEQRFDRGLKRNFLDVVNKTKYWDLYREMFEEIGDGDAAFREQFGEQFADAYEKQMLRFDREGR